MTHLQALINTLRHRCELRITITDHQTEIWLWTHPSLANGTQRLINHTSHPSAELAALEVMDQLATVC